MNRVEDAVLLLSVLDESVLVSLRYSGVEDAVLLLVIVVLLAVVVLVVVEMELVGLLLRLDRCARATLLLVSPALEQPNKDKLFNNK